jgi:transcriptional regulator with GAF, ATPase, and Fis domain
MMQIQFPATGIPLRTIEREVFCQAMRQAHGVQKEAARLLRVSPRVVNYRLTILDIPRDFGRHAAAEITPTAP